MDLQEIKERLENIKSRVKQSDNKELENRIEWGDLYEQKIKLCENLDVILENIDKTKGVITQVTNYLNKSK
jgi:archaellum component FlaC